MAEQTVAMSMSQFRELLTEIRKPPVDPIKEAQKVREKEMRDRGLKEMWERKERKKTICLHSRPDGSCVIAWAQQSDGQHRGYCPHCDSVFTKDDPNFVQLFNRNRGMVESVRVVA